MKKTVWLILAFGLMALAACSKDLSRSNAKQLLIEHYKFPVAVTAELDIGEKLIGYTSTKWLKALQGEGLVNYTFHRNFGMSEVISVSLTDKGKPYVVGDLEKRAWPNAGQTFVKVKLGERVLGDITGIVQAEDKRQAIIEYTWSYGNLTPFAKGYQSGSLFGMLAGNPVTEANKPNAAKAAATLYDDGWRITD